jgi:hypothetical protein
MSTRKPRYKSFSTPEATHAIDAFLVELIMQRKHGKRLPKYFWRLTQYKWIFTNELRAVKKFIKAHGIKLVCHVAQTRTLTSWANYAEVEALLQKEIERGRFRAAPKVTHIENKEKIKNGIGNWSAQKDIWTTLAAIE